VILNKLSWREPEEVNNLDTALVSLGFTYHIDTVPGIKGEVYIIDNFKGRKEGVFVIKVDDSFLSPVYKLYQIIPRWETNLGSIDTVVRDLKHCLEFFGN